MYIYAIDGNKLLTLNYNYYFLHDIYYTSVFLTILFLQIKERKLGKATIRRYGTMSDSCFCCCDKIVKVSYNNCCHLQIQTLGLGFQVTLLRVTRQIKVSNYYHVIHHDTASTLCAAEL